MSAVNWGEVYYILIKEYPSILRNTLSKRNFDSEEINANDAVSISIIKRSLAGKEAVEIIYALTSLEKINYPELNYELIKLISHTDQDVRLETLKMIQRRNIPEALNEVREQLAGETVSSVKAELIKTLCSIGETEVVEEIMPYLLNSESLIRAGALFGLLRYGGLEGMLAAGDILKKFIHSSKAKERIFAAEVIGDVGVSGFYRPLVNLLKDSNSNVKKAAIESASKLKNPVLWRLISDFLLQIELRSYASIAFVKGGDSGLPILETMFDNEFAPVNIKLLILHIFEKIKSKAVIDMLLKKIENPVGCSLRRKMINVLQLTQYTVEENKTVQFKTIIKKETEICAWLLTSISDFGEDEQVEMLTKSLWYEYSQAIQCIMSNLSILYSPQIIKPIIENLNSELSEKKAYALEILDNLLSADLKTLIMPLIEDLSLGSRLSRLEYNKFSNKNLSRKDRIADIMQKSEDFITHWTKSVAIYITGKLSITDFIPAIENSLFSDIPIIRESALWSLSRISTKNILVKIEPMLKDENKSVAELANSLKNTFERKKARTGFRYPTRSGRITADYFITTLEDKNESISKRRNSALALPKTGGLAAEEALLNILNSNDDQNVLLSALEAIITMDDRIKSRAKRFIPALLDKELTDSNETIGNICCLKNFEPARELTEALFEELNQNYHRILLLITLAADSDKYNLLYYNMIYQKKYCTPEIKDILNEILNNPFFMRHNYICSNEKNSELHDCMHKQNLEKILFATSKDDLLSACIPLNENNDEEKIHDVIKRIVSDTSFRNSPFTRAVALKSANCLKLADNNLLSDKTLFNSPLLSEIALNIKKN